MILFCLRWVTTPRAKLTNGKLKTWLKIQLFWFLFHYLLQLHGRFEECELTVDLP